MNTSKNKIVDEIHGCIVCANLFNIFAVYTPDGSLLDCTVTSPGGHIISDEHRPLVACVTHTAEQIEHAYKKWQSANAITSDNQQERK